MGGTQPTCSICGWKGLVYKLDDTTAQRNCYAAADRHARKKHGIHNNMDWTRTPATRPVATPFVQ